MGESASAKGARKAAENQQTNSYKANKLQYTIASDNLNQQTKQLINQNKDTQIKIDQTEKQRQAQAGLMTAGAAASGLQMTGSVADVTAEVDSQFMAQKDSLQRAFDITAEFTSDEYIAKQKSLLKQGLEIQNANADIQRQMTDAGINQQAGASSQQFWSTFGSAVGAVIGTIILPGAGTAVGGSLGGALFGSGTNY